MSRSYQQVLDALADVARLSDVEEGTSWRDAFFEEGGAGWALSRPTDPDRALLSGLAEELVRLDAHAGTIPERLHVEWLERILGIPRLPVVPDRVVVAATVEPKLAPAVVPRGGLLRGGKDAFGNERRYRTADALTAFGAGLTGVRVLVPGGALPGRPGLAFSAPDFPIVPPVPEQEMTEPAATHTLRIADPMLAFAAGRLDVEVTFVGATTSAVATLCAGAQWWYTRADGTPGGPIPASPSGNKVLLGLDHGCIDPQGGDPWIEARLVAGAAVPENLSFTQVKVVAARTDLVPDGAFANEGAVPHTKEFEPFGITAKVGDAFYVRCDEALSKPLASLSVSLAEFPPPASPSFGPWGGASDVIAYFNYLAAMIAHYAAMNAQIAAGTYTGPTFQWQVFRSGDWTEVSNPFGVLTGMPLNPASGGSDVTIVGGQQGRFVRAQLLNSDLGWRQYQQDLADFATDATQGEGTMPDPLEPQLYNGLRVAYKTVEHTATRVESTSGWRHHVKGAGAWSPFRKAVNGLGATGMVAIGVSLPADAAGSSLSLYVDLVSPSPCGSSDEAITAWEWWDGVQWQPLLVADGTNRMRESGLVRFVVPSGWAEGCADVSAESGRWFRFTTNSPARIGEIRNAIPDAVLAEFVSTAADPQQDPSSETALPVGTIKGPLSPIPGVKKMTNLASVRGRGPEIDERYLERASAHVRHRGRTIAAWDYERIITTSFPEIAAVQCLPHTNSLGLRSPGHVGIVLLPDQQDRPAPRASVSLAGRVRDTLRTVTASAVHTAILCPEYEPVRVDATITLRRGTAAITGKASILSAIETFLHPLGTAPVRWGQTLYASSVIAMLERLPEVDVVENFALRVGATVTEEVPVEPCRGLYCSSGDHQVSVKEQL
jgi:hypothetical protein